MNDLAYVNWTGLAAMGLLALAACGGTAVTGNVNDEKAGQPQVCEAHTPKVVGCVQGEAPLSVGQLYSLGEVEDVGQGDPGCIAQPGAGVLRLPRTGNEAAASEAVWFSVRDERTGALYTVGVATPGFTVGTVGSMVYLEVDVPVAEGADTGYLHARFSNPVSSVEHDVAIGQNSYPLLSDVREGAEECHADEQPCGRSYRSMIVEYATFERELKTGVTETFGQQQVMVTNDRFVRLDDQGGCDDAGAIDYLVGVVD